MTSDTIGYDFESTKYSKLMLFHDIFVSSRSRIAQAHGPMQTEVYYSCLSNM